MTDSHVNEEKVEFFSEGERVRGILRTPVEGESPYPAIVQGPGWLGLKDAKLYRPYHEALTAAGFAVLIFDYRGFGDSEGPDGFLSPAAQLQDLRNAVTYLTAREDIDGQRIGAFGSGGTGGGNAIMLAAHDARVLAAVSQVPVADGEDWLHRMRTEDEWLSFLQRLHDDRISRVTTGKGEWVHPREEIMVPTAERRATNVKKDVDDRVPSSVPLAAAEEILTYKPIEFVQQISPRALMVIGVENDAVTPTDHAVGLYEAAGSPKCLIMQRDTTHYAAYQQYGSVVIPRIVDWLTTHVRRGSVEERVTDRVQERVEYLETTNEH